MRKFLIALASILIIALTVYIIIAGISFAKVNGYKDISEINQELDINISKINDIKEYKYLSKQRELDTETSKLKETREDYLAKVEAAKLKGAKGSKLQIEVYELDFIWARVGNYATELGLEIKLDVFPGTEEKTLTDFKLYNLKLSVAGAYTDIVRFIYKIEGDRELSAQLSDFSMKPFSQITPTESSAENAEESTTNSTVGLIAEFTLKNVPLNHKNIMQDQVTDSGEIDINDLKLPQSSGEKVEGTHSGLESSKPEEGIDEDLESILGR